jgi:citrate lyase subunit beta/citryl-CoA lyase
MLASASGFGCELWYVTCAGLESALEKQMEQSRERSWLVAPLSRPDRIKEHARSGADAMVLDLVELVPEEAKHAARLEAARAIETVRAAGASVFGMIDPVLAYADLHACVWPGLNGIVVSRAESTAQIEVIDGLVTRLERERGIPAGAVEIVVALETARGNQDGYDIANASPRVTALTLGRADLIMDLRPEPDGEIHLMPYLMQRLIVLAGALGKTPLGAWWRAPDRGLLATPENTYRAAQRGRAIGFKGALCLRPDQIEPIHRAFA